MSVNAKKSMGWTIVLMLLGVVALYAGAESLVLLIPAATLIWYASKPLLRSGRN
jgi:hypothetical protein